MVHQSDNITSAQTISRHVLGECNFRIKFKFHCRVLFGYSVTNRALSDKESLSQTDRTRKMTPLGPRRFASTMKILPNRLV